MSAQHTGTTRPEPAPSLVFTGSAGSETLAGPVSDCASWAHPIPWTEAASYVGATETVEGLVAEASYRPGVNGAPTFLDVGGPWPDEGFLALIWGEWRLNFPFAPEDTYANETVCVTGTVQLYRGVPEIMVWSPAQIQIVPRTASALPCPAAVSELQSIAASYASDWRLGGAAALARGSASGRARVIEGFASQIAQLQLQADLVATTDPKVGSARNSLHIALVDEWVAMYDLEQDLLQPSRGAASRARQRESEARTQSVRAETTVAGLSGTCTP